MSIAAEKMAEVLALPEQDRAYLARQFIASLDDAVDADAEAEWNTDMNTLDWKPEKLHFRNVVLNAWVARSPSSAILECEMENLQPTIAVDETLFLRLPPAPRQPPAPEILIELWKVQGLGSFDSICLAKAVFNCPDDALFFEGVNSVEAIISMLSEGFVEGEFKMVWVSEFALIFNLTRPNTMVTRKQYRILDKLNKRFFGASVPTAHMSAPGTFVIGNNM